jgi:hypothetical protein
MTGSCVYRDTFLFPQKIDSSLAEILLASEE